MLFRCCSVVVVAYYACHACVVFPPTLFLPASFLALTAAVDQFLGSGVSTHPKHCSTLLTILWHHRHPDPRFEDPKILLGELTEVDPLIRLEIESELSAVPAVSSARPCIRRATHHWYSASTIVMGRPRCATFSRQMYRASCSSRSFCCTRLGVSSCREHCCYDSLLLFGALCRLGKDALGHNLLRQRSSTLRGAAHGAVHLSSAHARKQR